MSSDLIPWLHAYLAEDEDIVVPIKKMWNEWHAAHPETSLEAFTAAVLADAAVEAEGEVDHTRGLDWMGPEERGEFARDMEANGFFSGLRVRLKSRELTLAHVGRMIRKHNDRMMWALEQARQSLPPEAAEQEEGLLIDVIELARQFRQTLREAGLDPDETPDDADSES